MPTYTKKVTYMHYGEMLERNAKSKGVIGRPPTEHIKKRKEIVSELVSKYEQISEKDLVAKIKEEFAKLNSDPTLIRKYDIPTPQTLRKDVKECNGKIGEPTIYKELNSEELEELERLNYICRTYIRQVRVTSIDLDCILYNADSSKSLSTEKKFIKPVTSYRHETNEENSSNKEQKHPDNTLMHVLIIFTKDGFEDLIGNHFLENYEYVLYTSSHKRCIEIVLRLGKCASLLKAVHKLL